jgi:hypothetical protein
VHHAQQRYWKEAVYLLVDRNIFKLKNDTSQGYYGDILLINVFFKSFNNLEDQSASLSSLENHSNQRW